MLLSTPHLTTLLTTYRYGLLFPLAALEGPLVTLLAGFLASVGYMNFFVAYLVVVVGDLFADCLYYCLGRFGGESLVSRWGKSIGMSRKRVRKLERQFKHRGGRILLLGKLSHGIGAIFLVASGLAKMPFWKFLLYNTLGTLPKSLILLLIGYYFGFAITKINSLLGVVAIIIVTLFVAATAFYFFYVRRKDS